MPRLTVEEVTKRLFSKGITLLGKWEGTEHRYQFECLYGHQWEAYGYGPMGRYGCRKCANRLTREQVEARLVKRGFKLLDNDWRGVKSKYRFECAEGHIWIASANGILNRNRGCQKCAGTLPLSKAEVDALLAERSLKLCDSEWKGTKKSYRFACSEAHTWITDASSVLRHGTGCPECNVTVRVKLTTAEVNARLALRNLTLVGEWEGALKAQTFKCSLGHEWETTGAIVVSKGSGCPECARLRQKNRFSRI